MGLPILSERPALVSGDPLTVAEFRTIAEHPDHQDKELELWEGEIIEMPKPNPLHNRIVAEVLYWLMNYLKQYPELGEAFGDNNEFAPTDTVLVVPDASFISRAKLTYPYPQSFPFMPDLAVEVVSPANSADDLAQKTDQYLRYGARMVWEVYPKEQFVRVYTLEEGQLVMRQFGKEDTLSDIAFLPAFSLPVAQLFLVPTL